MKTMIDIPEPLYHEAKIRAVQSGNTLNDLILKAIQRELYSLSTPFVPSRLSTTLESPFSIDEQGWPVLKRAPEDGTVVTEEFINQLREEEGI